MDITGTFDNVKYSSVKQGMIDANIDTSITEWYGSYLNNQTATIQLFFWGGKHIRQLTKGTPKGVLSPLAWNMAFNSLLNEGPAKVIGHADYCVIIVRGKHQDTLVNAMQGYINKAMAWGDSADLQFSLEKTKVVFFTHK